MSKSPRILPLAAALAALAGVSATPSDPSNANATEPTEPEGVAGMPAAASKAAPNRIVTIGEDLLGFTVTNAANGKVVAQHESHASHSSHQSHYSSN